MVVLLSSQYSYPCYSDWAILGTQSWQKQRKASHLAGLFVISDTSPASPDSFKCPRQGEACPLSPSERSYRRNSLSANESAHDSGSIPEANQVCRIDFCEATTPTSSCTCYNWSEWSPQLLAAHISDRDVPLLARVFEFLGIQRQLSANSKC